MWKYNIPEEYEKKLQEIISPFSVEFAPDQENQLERTVDVLWNGLCRSSQSDPKAKMLVFGETENEVQELNRPVTASIINWVKEENTALMLSTAEGVVFCLSYVVVGDKEYALWLTPENAQRIYDAQKKLVDEYGLDIPREMTMWESICNFFSELILGYPIDTAIRRENYLKFYENAQKVAENTAALLQSGKTYQDGLEANGYAVARQYLDNKEKENIQQQEQQKQQEIENRQNRLKEEEEQAQQLQQQEEKQNQEKLDQKEQERLENIKKQQEAISKSEEAIRNYQPTYDKAKEVYENQKANHEETLKTMQQELDTLAKIPGLLLAAQKLHTELSKKLPEQEKLAGKKNSLDAALKEDESQLPGLRETKETSRHQCEEAKVEFDLAAKNCAAVLKTVEEFLLDQYQKGKADREAEFQEKQDEVNRQLEEQQRIIEERQKKLDELKPRKKLFGTPAEVKQRWEELTKEQKAAEIRHKELTALSKLQKKQFDETEAEQHKALVGKPSQQTREEAEQKMAQLREPYEVARVKYEAAKQKYEVVSNLLTETENRYKQNKESYDKNFGKGTKGESFNPEELNTMREQRRQASQQMKQLREQQTDLKEKTKDYQRVMSEMKVRFANTEKAAFDQVERHLESLKNGLSVAKMRLHMLENPVNLQKKEPEKQEVSAVIGKH